MCFFQATRMLYVWSEFFDLETFSFMFLSDNFCVKLNAQLHGHDELF